MPEPLLITLELTRARAAEDPYAFAEGRQEYLLREAGGVYDGFEILWDEALTRDLKQIGMPRPPAEVVARMGERLRKILVLAGWERHDREIGEATRAGRRVIVDFLSAAAELYSLPWELVPLRSTGQPLAELASVLIRYAWPATQTLGSKAPPEGGRILFAWSDAAGPVPHEAQEQVLRAAVVAAAALAPLALDVLPRATPEALIVALKGRPTILHLLCHGRGGAKGGLLLSSDIEGDEDVVDPTRLRQILAPVADSLRQVVLCACGSGAAASVASPLGSLAQAVHRIGVPSVIAFRIPVTVEGATAATRALYQGLFHELSSLEDAHLAVQTSLLGGTSLDWAALQLLARAEDGHDTRPVVFRPYRGLLAFGPEHRRFFFGRDLECNEVLTELDALEAKGQPRFQLVEGASGTGKSSLVLAGVVPVLLARGWSWVRMVPGTDPMAALETALAARSAASGRFLLVVDQLEEVFTQAADDAEGRAGTERFVRSLWALASDKVPVHIIATLRTDFRGRCGEVHLDEQHRMDQLFRPEMAAHHVFVAQMGPDQLREVIRRPAALVGLELPGDLADRALADVGAEPGALPLLEYTLDLLWERREGRTLSGATYSALGGVSGALSGRAEAVFGAFDAAQQKAARRLLVRLVGVRADHAQDTRRRVPVAELRPREPAAAATFDAVLGALVDARLLVRGGDGAPTVEVAHEALIRTWARIRTWVEEDHEMLAALDKVEAWVAQWRTYPEALLSGKQLGYAQEIRERHEEDLSTDALKLIIDSEAEAKRRLAQSRRRLRLGVAVAVAVAAIFAVLGLVAWREKGKAEDQAARARDQGRMVAVREATGDPTLQAVLLREVERPEATLGWTSRALTSVSSSRADIVLTGHNGPVLSAAYSPDGTSVVTTSDDNTARVWHIGSTAPPIELKGHEDTVNTAVFSPDGARVLTASDDKTARVWTLNDPEHPVILQGHENNVRSAVFSSNGRKVVTASADNTARVWDLSDPEHSILLKEEDGTVYSAMFSPNDEQVVTASFDHTAVVWTLSDPAHPRVLRGEGEGDGNSHISVAFSSDGDQLVMVSGGRAAQVWSLSNPDLPILLEDKQNPLYLYSAAFSPNGNQVLTRSETGVQVWTLSDPTHHIDLPSVTEDYLKGVAVFSKDGKRVLAHTEDQVAIWNLSDPAHLIVITGERGEFNSAMFSPDGDHVVTASSDWTARVWALNELSSLQPLRGHENVLTFATFSPDGTQVVTTSADATARVWPLRDPSHPIVFKGHEDTILSSAFSPDGASVLTASEDHTARVWRLTDPDSPIVLQGHEDEVNTAMFSPEGGRVVTASDDNTARVWTLSDPQHPLALEGHTDDINSARFSPDGARVVTASDDGTARVWTLSDPQHPLVLEGHKESITEARFSEDGSRVVTAAEDDTARVWTLSDPGSPVVLEGHESDVNSASFSPDGTLVVTASDDNTAQVWALSDPRHPVVLRGHEAQVYSSIFSPDGTRVATGSRDRTARIWTLGNQGALIVLNGHTDSVNSAEFAPDGLHVATASDDKTARIWTLRTSELMDLLWRGTSSCLLPADREARLGETPEDAITRHDACLAKVAEYRAKGAYK